MKLLFSSSDNTQLERVSRRLAAAGIACHVQKESVEAGTEHLESYPGLWVKNDGDYRMACVIFVSNCGRA